MNSKKLPAQTFIVITYLFSAKIRLKYVPNTFNTAQSITRKKTHTVDEEVISNKPGISKLLKKLLIKRFKPLISIPHFSYEFREHHSTMYQFHKNLTI